MHGPTVRRVPGTPNCFDLVLSVNTRLNNFSRHELREKKKHYVADEMSHKIISYLRHTFVNPAGLKGRTSLLCCDVGISPTYPYSHIQSAKVCALWLLNEYIFPK